MTANSYTTRTCQTGPPQHHSTSHGNQNRFPSLVSATAIPPPLVATKRRHNSATTAQAAHRTTTSTPSILHLATAPISAGLLRDTEGYFRALTSYREGDAAPIIAAFADAGWFAAQSGMELIDRLVELVDEVQENLSGFRSYANVWKVVPLLISHPALTAPALSQLTGLTPTCWPAKKPRLDPRRNPPSAQINTRSNCGGKPSLEEHWAFKIYFLH